MAEYQTAGRFPTAPRGRRLGMWRAAGDAAPPWLYHHLTVSGPGEVVNAFAAAARRAGVMPQSIYPSRTGRQDVDRRGFVDTV